LDYLTVGEIVNTQGIKGEVRVASRTDFPEERFQAGSRLLIFQDGKFLQEVTVAAARKKKNLMIVKFKEFSSINEVEQLKGSELKIAKDALQELAADEYYYHEIIGLTVETLAGEVLGTIKEILSPGANDVWVVERPGKSDLLIPYIKEVVRAVDLENGRVKVELLEGLDPDED
jgi:16S rRNA processing protein RimM